MDKQKTLNILEALANGVDPLTGEVFPPESPYQHVDVIRALFNAVAILKDSKEKIQKPGPVNQGSKWTTEENEQLKQAFLNGVNIPDLAKGHQRTTGAIRSRLQKLGLVDVFGNRLV